MRLLTAQRAVFRPRCADEPSESPEGRLEVRYSRLVGKPEVIRLLPVSPSSARHRRAPQQNFPQRRTLDGLVELRQIPTKLRHPFLRVK